METNSGRKFIPSLRIIVVFIKPKSATYQRKKKKIKQIFRENLNPFFSIFFSKEKKGPKGWLNHFHMQIS